MSISPQQWRVLAPVLRARFTERRHGTRHRYMGGCHCMLCRAANSRYETARSHARSNGDWNGIVSSATARAWIARLSKRGIGRNAIADASGLSRTIINDIKIGRARNIRARTERRIVAVDESARSDHSLVDAPPTWKLLDELIARGYSQAWLALKLGYKTQRLQFGRQRITAISASRVERLHKLLNQGRLPRP